MKYHPDRFTDPEEKKKAKVKFQEISSAYSVLRDGNYQTICYAF
jgi:curved DNA-binding protein CbpA